MSERGFETFETAWCPGCGNFNILDSLKNALTDLQLDPHDVLMVGGIGQAAKLPQYISANSFCGLHGRSVPPAAAAKIVNPKLTVIINSGDGDSYGEGGNHFIHNIRRNIDIAHFIHDNQVYGLTKGQASPTADPGSVTPVQVEGNLNIPFNPVLMAIAAGAGFVARSFSGKPDHLREMMKQAIRFKGYAMVDILQPCVSFNKINTFAWYNQRVYELDGAYDNTDRAAAMIKSMEFGDRIPIGVLYQKEQPTFHEQHEVLRNGQILAGRKNDPALVRELMMEMV
jgi:2-oxoglutarate ferredoxin oxidoreductase subunit beta